MQDIKRDIEEVDKEIEKEENFEVDEEQDFEEYDKTAKPSVFSRMWKGVKNAFSSDDEDDEDNESKSDEDDEEVKEVKTNVPQQAKIEPALPASNEKGYLNSYKKPELNGENNGVKQNFSQSQAPSTSIPLNVAPKSKIALHDLDDDDMGRMIKISVGILERLPQNEFEKFKQTQDFNTYKEIIKKYKKK